MLGLVFSAPYLAVAPQLAKTLIATAAGALSLSLKLVASSYLIDLNGFGLCPPPPILMPVPLFLMVNELAPILEKASVMLFLTASSVVKMPTRADNPIAMINAVSNVRRRLLFMD